MLAFQHVFAFMGATVLVPLLTGLSISTALFGAGFGTLIFHGITKRKVPMFLGSSFAYIGGILAVTEGGTQLENLPYACAAIAFSGLVYVALSILISIFTIERVMKFFPPYVTAPMVMAIGIILMPSAVNNCETNWPLALITFGAVVIINIWGKGLVKKMPILIGLIISYIVALAMGVVDTTGIKEAAWIGLPVHTANMGLFAIDFSAKFAKAFFAIFFISIATCMEHIGDASAVSATTGKDYLRDPGLHRTLLGDGIATIFAGLIGAPANTSYGENTGVLTITKVFDPFVIRLSAVFAIILSFCPKFDALICSVPAANVGGISLMLYGMISIIGVKNLIKNKVDYDNTRNLIITIIVFFGSLAVDKIGGIPIPIGSTTITITALAFGAIAGILMNIILPGESTEFGQNQEGDEHRGIHID
ncbi:MAG: uracil-xanthine permease family protein [Candidatus Saccharibacteria bacterium]|nr:uracil-xanthine permease family protein [Candidatus Saccharibacteria bacterium]